MKKWYHILWGSKEEDELVTRIQDVEEKLHGMGDITCLLYTSPSPRD